MSRREKFAFIAAAFFIALLWVIAAAWRDEVSERRFYQRELKRAAEQISEPCLDVARANR
jgi:hypothetical protein